jgi:hypothetical protein
MYGVGSGITRHDGFCQLFCPPDCTVDTFVDSLVLQCNDLFVVVRRLPMQDATQLGRQDQEDQSLV